MTDRDAGDRRGPRRVQSLFGGRDSRLGNVRSQARGLARQELRLMEALGGSVPTDWRLARVDEQGLTLTVSSSAAASALRYRQRLILQGAAKALGIQPKRLHIRVTAPPPRRAPPKPRKMSAEAAAAIEQGAAGMTDERLREALLRLARHGRKSGADGT